MILRHWAQDLGAEPGCSHQKGRIQNSRAFVGVGRPEHGGALGKWVVEQVWAVACGAEMGTPFLNTVNLRLLETSK